jgi:hypothetical protein
MTPYAWKGASGDWNTASNWTPAGGPPKSTDSATINGSTTDAVTVDTADVAKSLTLSDTNTTLNDDGTSASLAIGGTLTMSNGTLNISPNDDGGVLAVGALNLSGGALNIDSGGELKLNGTLNQTGGALSLSGGTISGGTINSTAGTLTLNSGTLSGVTFDGPLNLTASATSVHLANGTKVIGPSGSGPGTINVTGYDAYLYFDNTQTVSNDTINLGNTSGGWSLLYNYDPAGTGKQVVTFASSVTIDVQGDAEIQSSAKSGTGIVNNGVIDVAGSGGYLEIDPRTFINKGTIDVANGGFVLIGPTTFTTTPSSAIEIGANSSVRIQAHSAWSNLGSITLASGASLILGGSMTTTGLGSITNSGGTVYLAGTLNNAGNTLNGSAFGALTLYGGFISGGTVTSAGVSFTQPGAELSGVTFEGPLNLTGAGAYVQLASGTTVVGSSGPGPGTINDTGSASYLYFDNTQTVSDDTINLGNTGGGYSHLYEFDRYRAGNQVLTLASNVTVHVQGDAEIHSSDKPGDGVVNDGAIDVTGSGGDLIIDPRTFTNKGTIDVANGGSVTIAPTNQRVTGKGTDTISGDSTLEFDAGVSSATTLGSQNIGFTGGGTLDLLKPTNFYGEISGFAAGDTVELLGSWTFFNISQASGVTTLTVASGSTTHAFEFVGNYGQNNFSITSGTATAIGYHT